MTQVVTCHVSAQVGVHPVPAQLAAEPGGELEVAGRHAVRGRRGRDLGRHQQVSEALNKTLC